MSVVAREEEGGSHNAAVIILTIIPGGSLARLALAPPTKIWMLQQPSTCLDTRNTKPSKEHDDNIT